jgi:hypothetical protein
MESLWRTLSSRSPISSESSAPARTLLFGFAGTSVYQLFPGQENIAERAVLLKNLAGKGLSKIYGAAYDGYFLY